MLSAEKVSRGGTGTGKGVLNDKNMKDRGTNDQNGRDSQGDLTKAGSKSLPLCLH